MLAGTVLTSTFLGAVTRVRVSTALGEIAADVRTVGPPPGSPLAVGFLPESARVLALE